MRPACFRGAQAASLQLSATLPATSCGTQLPYDANFPSLGKLSRCTRWQPVLPEIFAFAVCRRYFRCRNCSRDCLRLVVTHPSQPANIAERNINVARLSRP
jgi:hypothetical protein